MQTLIRHLKDNRHRPATHIFFILSAALLLSSCAAGSNPVAGTAGPGGEIAGFWLGLWHGAIALVTFVISLFDSSVGIYEVHNNGTWYNLGFVLGALIFLGGSHGARKKN